jgi:hypothetical protein
MKMKVFTYSEARQNLSKLLTIAQKEEVEIKSFPDLRLPRSAGIWLSTLVKQRRRKEHGGYAEQV